MSTNSTDYSIFDRLFVCFFTPASRFHTIAFSLVNIPFILPLCLYILYLGIQQWRRKAKISHTDFFTYNMVVIHLISILSSVLSLFNLLLKSKPIITLSIFMFFISSSAVVYFQILTCLERYMAVVHPVSYLQLRSQTWALIRNISCSFVWLQCILQSVHLSVLNDMIFTICLSLITVFGSFSLVLFCYLRVLCVLIRPGPGDGARVNQSKLRALYTISAITACLLLKFGGDMFGMFIFTPSTDIDSKCSVWFSLIWLTLPSTLVLPLLYLHRNGKMICLKASNK